MVVGVKPIFKSGKHTLKVLICAGVAALFATPMVAEAASNRTGLVAEDEVAFRGFKQRPHFRSYIPSQVDLSSRFPAIRSQGDQGSCVAWATGYYMRSYYENIQGNVDSVPFSPAYIYNQTNLGGCDQGSRISDALKLLTAKGIAPLKAFPYTDANCSSLPTSDDEQLARLHKIKDWSSINHLDIDDIRGTLSRGHPVIIGMRIDTSFDQFKGGRIYDSVAPKDANGHAMALVGYDDTRSAFKLANSWGTQWGDAGYAWLSYDAYLKNARYAFVADPGFDPKRAPFAPGKTVVEVTVKPKPVPEPIVKPQPQPKPKPEPKPIVKPKPVPQPLPIVIDKGRVTELLAGVECASLSPTYTPSGGVQINGYAGSIKHLGNVGRSILGVAGVSSVKLATKVRAWPQCEALQTFKRPLAEDYGLTAAVRSQGAAAKLTAGEYLAVEITAPNFPSYLYVTYLQAGGDAVHLRRPFWLDAPLASGHKLVLGADETKVRFKIQAPFGKEMIMVIASERPLFNKGQPLVEEERQYLTAFRRVLLGLAQSHPNNKVTAVFIDLKTTGHK